MSDSTTARNETTHRKTNEKPGPIEDTNSPAGKILSLDKAQRMAEFFGVLGDPNRWRILSALALGELQVGELAKAVDMNLSAVSHQLRVLRIRRLVSYRKRGRNVYYCLQDHHILNLYQEASEHLDEPNNLEKE